MPKFVPLADRDALRVMFVITCMPVGGAETLLVNLIRHMDRSRFSPELCCLKYPGPLGEVLAKEIPTFTGLISHKFDIAVWGRLTRLLRERKIDAVITVGTGGDKMFWGRLAACRAGVPVIASALHSTGLPDRVELPNRLLARWTDAFIAVAAAHGKFLAESEGCPADKVWVVPNGVDTNRFSPHEPDAALRAELGLPASAPVAGILAALRPEKNHELFLRVAAEVRQRLPEAKFLVIGDGLERARLETLSRELSLTNCVQFLGTRSDIPELLSLLDVMVLTSHMEANPVSILEAMAAGKAVLAPSVGSISESVEHEQTGILCPAGDQQEFSARLTQLLSDRPRAQEMGLAGRRRAVECYSLQVMVDGYQDMIEEIYSHKCRGGQATTWPTTKPGRSTKTESSPKADDTLIAANRIVAWQWPTGGALP